MNKYAICYSLYDNYNLSDTNLYYYKGIIHSLGFHDRNFDIYIDTTQYCHDILQKIINQEGYNISNVYFNIHDSNDLEKGMLWRIKTCFDNADKYDIIGFSDSDLETGENYFYQFDKNPNYSVYCPQQVLNGHLSFNWNYVQQYPGCNFYIRKKSFITDFNKIKDVINNIIKFDKYPIEYEFDEFLLTALCIKESYKNKCLYITDHIFNNNTNFLDNCTNIYKYNEKKWYWLKNDIRKSKYFNDDFYSLDGVSREFSYRKPSIKQHISENDKNIKELRICKTKHLMHNICKYILDYCDKINYEKYNFDYIQKNSSKNIKKCIVYCVDDNKKINKLLKYSLKTYYEYNNLDCYIVTLKNNIYIQDILDNFPQVKIIYVDDIYNKYLLNLDKKVRPEISKFAYIKIFIPVIDELRNNYDYVLVCDADVEHYHKINEEFLEISNDIDIIGHTQYDDDECIKSIKNKIGGEYTNQYINCGYFIYNIKNKCFNKNYYLPLLLKYINISNTNNFNNFEQDALLIFKEVNIRQFNSTYVDYCYTLDKNTNHNNYRNIHYICGGKEIMLSHCQDNILYYPKKDYNNIYIYSNYNSHGERYRNIISNKIKQENNIHVFLNTCVPLQLNKQYYKNTINYFFGRCVGEPEKFENQKYLGEKYSLENINMFDRYYIIEDNYHFKQFINNNFVDIDDDKFYQDCYNLNLKILKNHKLSTGILTYMYIKNIYPTHDIYLVDFYGSANKDKIALIHGNSYYHSFNTERFFYIENNVKILYT